MHHSRRPTHRCALFALCLALATLQGCRTQKDAEAAASQMTTTAKTLCDYYTALDHVLAENQDAFEAQSIIEGTAPQDLSGLRRQIQARIALAKQIGDLSTAFGKLTKSTAAKDSSAAAGKLNTDVLSVSGISGNDTEASAVTAGIQEIVTLLQEHEERKAATKLAPLSKSLLAFYESEKDRYVMINKTYLSTARNVARAMVNRNQVDPASLFASSLQPFGLTPAVDDNKVRAAMQPYLLDRIDQQRDAKIKAAEDAANDLDKGLTEMNKRIDLVAHENPMDLRIPPFSLASVETWVAQVTK